MQKWQKLVITSIALILGTGYITAKQPQAQTTIQHWIRHNMPKYHIIGASVAVIQNYTIAWSQGFGYRNLAKKQKITKTTLFNAASISKPIAAVATIITFMQKGLSLNENVNHFLVNWKIPPYPSEHQHPVTMRLLLAHSAGITDFRYKGYLKNQKIPTLDQTLKGEAPANTPAVTVKWQPGSKFAYSPASYTIAEKVLVDIYKQPFPSIMNNLLFKPLKMQHSAFGVHMPLPHFKNIAIPYLPNGKPMPNAPLLFAAQAAGGLWTTPDDLAKFVIAIEKASAGKSNSVITPAVVKILFTPGVSHHMGTGMEINLNKAGQPVKSGSYFAHSGWNSGYLGLILGNRAGGNGVVILVNTAPYMTYKGKVIQNDFIMQLANKIAASYHWKTTALSKKRNFI